MDWRYTSKPGYALAPLTVVFGTFLLAYRSYIRLRDRHARLAQLSRFPGFRFIEADIADRDRIAALFDELRPRRVLHLATNVARMPRKDRERLYLLLSDRARRDAERYRWIRLRGAWDTEAFLNGLSPEQYDDALDAAMAAEASGP